MLGLPMGASDVCGGSNGADDYSVARAAREVLHRSRADLVRVIFLPPLAEEVSRQSVMRCQVPAAATRARTNPAPGGVRLACCPACIASARIATPAASLGPGREKYPDASTRNTRPFRTAGMSSQPSGNAQLRNSFAT